MRANNNREIEQLRALIQDLQIRVNHLEAREREPPIAEARAVPDEAVERPQPEAHRDFRVGDRVVVTNNYRGQRGLEGTVVRVSDEWIHFETERLGIRRRKRPNLRRI